MPLFHDPVDPNTQVVNGHISKDGHQFECEHHGSYHIVFVIDKSGSMASTDVKPDDKTGSYKIIQNHNNRLGAVYECMKQFVGTRCVVNRTNQVNDNIMSFVLFDDNPTIVMQNRKFDYSDSLIDELCKYGAGGWTDYVKAVRITGDIIQRYKKQAR